MGRNPCQGARSDQRFPFRSCQRSCVRTPPIQEDPPSEDEGETCDVSVWPVWEYTTHDLSRGRRIFNPAHRPPVDCSALSASNTREQIPGASQPPGSLSAESTPRWFLLCKRNGFRFGRTDIVGNQSAHNDLSCYLMTRTYCK